MKRLSSHTLAADRRLLQRSRAGAVLLLLLAAALFLVSAYYQHRHPAWGYLKAFAEAAMVGGLADWFAVSALFRHPLGLPIPHTAIIPRKQAHLAQALGRFIEHNFLQGGAIAGQVYRYRPSVRLLNWLAEPARRQYWQPWLAAQLSLCLCTLKPRQVANLISQWLAVSGADIADGRRLGQGLAKVLQLLRQQGVDVRLLRALLQHSRRCLQDEATRTQLAQSLQAWAGHIEREAPSAWDRIKAGFKTTVAEKVDDWVAAKALDWADSYVAAALADDNHVLWQAYRRRLDVLIRGLRQRRSWQRRLTAAQQQWAASVALHRILARSWRQWCRWSAADARQAPPFSWQQQQLARLFDYLWTQAQRHPAVLHRADVWLAGWLRQVIGRYKHQAARFVADKVSGWDSRLLVDKLESGIGRDLQYIRINGTLVGGLVGLLIYALSRYLPVWS